jgi:tetratricopeptide (TPR) repeat protein
MKTNVILWVVLFTGWSLMAQTRAGEVQPYSAQQNYQIGRDLERQNQMSDAIPYYNEAIRRCMDEITNNSATADSYVILAWTLSRQQRYSEVLQWGERGLRVSTDYRLIETMGEAYFYLKNYDRSLTFFQRYVNAVPQGSNSSIAYFLIGEIYRLREQYHHADIAYTTAVTLNPNNSLWWYRLGLAREAAGTHTYAIQAYERAIKLNPNNREASEALERSRRLSLAR